MNKRTILFTIFERTRSSYWFLPSVLALLAIIASQLSLHLDHNRDSFLYVWPESWETTQVEGARATLSVIAQSVLGVVGVMFSVTIVAVSFASGNFGPRLIGNFMRDRGTQWSLGLLIGTFVFALLILRAVHSAETGEDATFEAFVPHMSLGIALGLTGISIAAVIYYVHHIPETINVSNISAGLGKRLRDALIALIDKQDETGGEDLKIPTDRDADHLICLNQSGYVQSYDQDMLCKFAQEHDLYIFIRFGPGDFVSVATPVMEIWSHRELSEEDITALKGNFLIGDTPTETQNLLFIVQQLVEMIARALSPGVNDPYTAVNCLNWLYAALTTASNYKGGLPVVRESRVWTDRVTFEDIFDAGIARSYAYVKSDALTKTHLVTMLERLADEMTSAPDAKIVDAFRRQIAETA